MSIEQIHVGEPLAIAPEERASSLVDMVHRSVKRFGECEAFRWKSGGSWASWTYRELWDEVRAHALAMGSLGVGRGTRVAIISRSRPEWVVADLAALSLGAVTCPIYHAESAARTEHILASVQPAAVVVEDRRVARDVRPILERVPSIGVALVFDAAPGLGEPFRPFAEARVDEPDAAAVGRWEAGWRAIGREEVATIVHTSGSTGEPKGAVLTHGSLLHTPEAGAQILPFSEHDVGLSTLPLSHVMERVAGMFVPLHVGAAIAFAEPLISRWARDLLEVQPTVMVTVPPFFVRMHRQVLAAVEASSAWRRALFAWAVQLGRRHYANHLAARQDGPLLSGQLRLANRLVFNRIRERTGGRFRFFASASAPLPREIGEIFYAMGILILEGYGLTEASGMLTITRPDSFKFGTVGQPAPGTEIGIDSETGEICARGPQIMAGYLDRPEETAACIDADGWFHTGDIGRFDEAGRLCITDRLKNLIVLANGKKVMPGPMETALVTSPYIAQAVILGDGEVSTGALLAPNFENLRAWAAAQGLDGDDGALSASESVHELLEAEVRRLLGAYAAYERPRRVAVLPRELKLEEDEITPIGKPKRFVIVQRWPDQIRRLFGDAA